jgi:hypothetical protein
MRRWSFWGGARRGGDVKGERLTIEQSASANAGRDELLLTRVPRMERMPKRIPDEQELIPTVLSRRFAAG